MAEEEKHLMVILSPAPSLFIKPIHQLQPKPVQEFKGEMVCCRVWGLSSLLSQGLLITLSPAGFGAVVSGGKV